MRCPWSRCWVRDGAGWWVGQKPAAASNPRWRQQPDDHSTDSCRRKSHIRELQLPHALPYWPKTCSFGSAATIESGFPISQLVVAVAEGLRIDVTGRTTRMANTVLPWRARRPSSPWPSVYWVMLISTGSASRCAWHAACRATKRVQPSRRPSSRLGPLTPRPIS